MNIMFLDGWKDLEFGAKAHWVHCQARKCCAIEQGCSYLDQTLLLQFFWTEEEKQCKRAIYGALRVILQSSFPGEREKE